jgi:hypothetical protein
MIIVVFIALAAFRWWKAFNSPDGERYLKRRMQGPFVPLTREEIASDEPMTLKDEITNLILEAEEFIRSPGGTTNGADLASRLRSGAIGLGSNKATEFSPDNQKLALLAAKVALLTFGRHSAKLEPFERDVYYYNAFPSVTIGSQYDAFKGSL